MSEMTKSAVFDYKALRLLMGIIAFSLPWIVTVIASDPLHSISASYYTEARDIFTGLLFVVSALLWAYNGHTVIQKVMSKIASIMALCVALFPTTCETCETNPISIIHYTAAVGLFMILAYFCFGPFRQKTKGQGGKKGRRSIIYLICGLIMIISMASLVIARWTLSYELFIALSITYWVETIALSAFGVAWIVSGKYITYLADKNERLQLFEK